MRECKQRTPLYWKQMHSSSQWSKHVLLSFPHSTDQTRAMWTPGTDRPSFGAGLHLPARDSCYNTCDNRRTSPACCKHSFPSFIPALTGFYWEQNAPRLTEARETHSRSGLRRVSFLLRPDTCGRLHTKPGLFRQKPSPLELPHCCLDFTEGLFGLCTRRDHTWKTIVSRRSLIAKDSLYASLHFPMSNKFVQLVSCDWSLALDTGFSGKSEIVTIMK